MLFANYLTGSSDIGGLEFSQAQKGILMGVGTGILYFLPVLTGAIADRYGYKKVLFFAFIVYTSAFILLPQFSSFTQAFSSCIIPLRLVRRCFKPVHIGNHRQNYHQPNFLNRFRYILTWWLTWGLFSTYGKRCYLKAHRTWFLRFGRNIAVNLFTFVL